MIPIFPFCSEKRIMKLRPFLRLIGRRLQVADNAEVIQLRFDPCVIFSGSVLRMKWPIAQQLIEQNHRLPDVLFDTVNTTVPLYLIVTPEKLRKLIFISTHESLALAQCSTNRTFPRYVRIFS